MVQIELSEQDAAKTIEVQKGDFLLVRLEENPTTGFLWADAEIQGPELSLRGSDWSPEGNAIGSGGTRILRFEASQAGEVHLALRLIQEWEPDQIAKEFQVRVRVIGDG